MMIYAGNVQQAVAQVEGASDGPLLHSANAERWSKIGQDFVALQSKLEVESHVVFPEEADFPDTLSSVGSRVDIRALVAFGNLELLNSVAVGICGSRKATDRGIHITTEACGDLAREGVIIVSGYAAGVDEAAHRSALEQGGSTICVLAEGINHFRIKRSLRDFWDWKRVLVVSQFGFGPVWQASRAMKRNKTIVALSKATLVVEARDTGGTLDAGFTALKLGKPLLVVVFADAGSETAGNKLLLQNGGIPFRKSRSTGGPALENLNRIIGTTH